MKKLTALLIALTLLCGSCAFAYPDVEPGDPFNCTPVKFRSAFEALMQQSNLSLDITWETVPDTSYGYPIHIATALDGVLTMRGHCSDGTNIDTLELTVIFTPMTAEQKQLVTQYQGTILPAMFMAMSMAENGTLSNDDVKTLLTEIPVMVQPMTAYGTASDEHMHDLFEVCGKAMGYPYYAFAQLNGDPVNGTIAYDIIFMSESSSIGIS